MTRHYSDVGQANLVTLDEAHRFTEWMYSIIRPYLRGPILEIGSGRGTYSKKLLRDFRDQRVTLSDIDPTYVVALKRAYASALVDVREIDLMNNADLRSMAGYYHSAFALNVLEHISDDVLALRQVRDVLAPGGVFVVLVPAHPALYNCIDEAVGHHRRYSKSELLQKAAEAGFVVRDAFYFNALSIPGWFLNGNLLRRSVVSTGLVRVYELLIPIMKWVEQYILRRRVGISLVAILER